MRIVYLLPVRELEQEETARLLCRKLDKERLEKAQRYRSPADRARSLGAGALLQYGVQKYRMQQYAEQRSGMPLCREQPCGEQQSGMPLCREQPCGEQQSGMPLCREQPCGEQRSGMLLCREQPCVAQQSVIPQYGEQPCIAQQSGIPLCREQPYTAYQCGALVLLTVEGILEQLQESPLDFHFAYGAAGKPYLPEGPFFSLSHSGDYAACAISDCEIGLDIQQCKSTETDRLARRFFTEAEQNSIFRYEGEQRTEEFYRLWARKEAYGKLTGGGLKDGMAFEVSSTNPSDAKVYFQDFCPAQGYQAALCRRVSEHGECEADGGECYQAALCRRVSEQERQALQVRERHG